MKRKWKIIYYTTEKNECPIEDFINKRSVRNQAKIFNWLEQLEINGPNLPRPYADILEDGIHELRIKLSGDQIRILYFFIHKDYIILTHAFSKKTDRVPGSEIIKAKKIRESFIKQNSDKD